MVQAHTEEREPELDLILEALAQGVVVWCFSCRWDTRIDFGCGTSGDVRYNIYIYIIYI